MDARSATQVGDGELWTSLHQVVMQRAEHGVTRARRPRFHPPSCYPPGAPQFVGIARRHASMVASC